MGKNILVVFGTRPEAIKLAPLILSLKKDTPYNVLSCSTGQHREMLKPVLKFFGIEPNFDLDLMQPSQSLADLSHRMLLKLEEILKLHPIDGVIVQGDTTTSYITSLAAFYRKIPVIHVEAGLRSGDMYSPFPEEFFRRSISLVASLHFCPTLEAKQNLLSEGIEDRKIFVTGNTGIDALFMTRTLMRKDREIFKSNQRKFKVLDPKKKLVLVTVHRRESFGAPMQKVFKGILRAIKKDDLQVVIPLHLNPEVRKAAKDILGKQAAWMHDGAERGSKQAAWMHDGAERGSHRIWLCDPLEYMSFVALMNKAKLIVTDSGGVQEEAPSLGKPVFVVRDNTERGEAIKAGTSRLIPPDERKIAQNIHQIFGDHKAYQQMARVRNPFGDGKASERISAIVQQLL